MPRIVTPGTRLVFLLVASLPTIAIGCTLTLVSPYDPIIDEKATALQAKMDGFLTTLESNVGTPRADFEPNAEFYAEYAVELRSVLVRARVHPKNHLTEEQLQLMLKNLEALRRAHEASPVPEDAIGTYRGLFNQGWGAIIELELAKKREG